MSCFLFSLSPYETAESDEAPEPRQVFSFFFATPASPHLFPPFWLAGLIHHRDGTLSLAGFSCSLPGLHLTCVTLVPLSPVERHGLFPHPSKPPYQYRLIPFPRLIFCRNGDLPFPVFDFSARLFLPKFLDPADRGDFLPPVNPLPRRGGIRFPKSRTETVGAFAVFHRRQ